MTFDDDITACAAQVERGDPDRFRAVMAAPVAARVKLFPIYAFNLEIARAPWVTAEAMIAEMRLQWWRDALEEIAQGATVRRHEVVTPLSRVLDAPAARTLDLCVGARRWDIYKDPFEDADHFARYLDETAGGLLWIAARALGETDEARVRAWGRAQGLVNWLMAIPALENAGRIPLVDGRAETIVTLADTALAALPKAPKNPAMLACWKTKALLKQIRDNPRRVADGTLGLSPFADRISLLKASALGL